MRVRGRGAVEFPILLYEAEPQFYSEGEVIFREGDVGDVMYAVKKGRISLRLGETEVESVGPNGLFGEMALIDDSPRSATAVAVESSELVPVDRSRFEHLVERWPGFALSVMELMAERIRRLSKP
jgi:CRP/FNR family cyclic AMP-dependent transcriptional regulator